MVIDTKSFLILALGILTTRCGGSVAPCESDGAADAAGDAVAIVEAGAPDGDAEAGPLACWVCDPPGAVGLCNACGVPACLSPCDSCDVCGAGSKSCAVCAAMKDAAVE